MELLSMRKMLCISCMEEHDVQIVRTTGQNIFKGVEVTYPCNYYYCDRADELYADESMIVQNDSKMKNA